MNLVLAIMGIILAVWLAIALLALLFQGLLWLAWGLTLLLGAPGEIIRQFSENRRKAKR